MSSLHCDEFYTDKPDVSVAAKFLRVSGVFLLNVLSASIVSGMLASPFEHFDRNSIHATILRIDLINAIAAFGLGYFVYRRWRSAASKWVWIAGLCWFAQRAVRFWYEQRTFSVIHVYQGTSIFWEMSGNGCEFNFQSCSDFIGYTIPLLRTTFYSLGAFCCWAIGKFGVPGILEYVLLGTKREVATSEFDSSRGR
jgi:hypothetical protein